jgi:hypothetical protein
VEPTGEAKRELRGPPRESVALARALPAVAAKKAVEKWRRAEMPGIPALPRRPLLQGSDSAARGDELPK